MKKIFYILSLMLLIFGSCGSKVKPEMKEEWKSTLSERVVNKFFDSPYEHSDFNLEITNIKEQQYEFKGDKYGSYQVGFEYAFEDGSVPVKVTGLAIFSYDGSLCNVYGCPGIFIKEISVNSVEQKLDDSKYYIEQCEW